MNHPDFLTPMQALAREAGAVLISYFGKVAIEYKGEADLVTAADRSSEKLIVESIRRQWPHHDLIGEEGSRTETGSDYRWYVDPLDGTTNLRMAIPSSAFQWGWSLKANCWPEWCTTPRAMRCLPRRREAAPR